MKALDRTAPRASVRASVAASLRWARWLLLALMIIFALAAINPVNRSVWLLENALFVLVVGCLALTTRSFPLSRVSYILIFSFLCLHQIGAHYTYTKVPYDAAWEALTGQSLTELFGWRRNHYDRFVHFTYGLLLAYPIREAMLRIAGVRGFWGYLLPLGLMMSTSMLYELIEWATVVGVAGDQSETFLGAQGDVWDAQQDMLMASIGALLAMLINGAINARLQRDFAREWSESVRVKQLRPLGENELAKQLDQRR